MLERKAIEILQKQNAKAVAAYLKKNYPNANETKKNLALIKDILIPCLYNENPGVVKVALDYFELDPNMNLGDNNLKPLHLAAASGSFEAISDLLNAGADPKAEVTLSNKSLASFMHILEAKVHTQTAQRSAQLLRQLEAQKINQKVEKNDLSGTEEENFANTGSFSASASLLRKRK